MQQSIEDLSEEVAVMVNLEVAGQHRGVHAAIGEGQCFAAPICCGVADEWLQSE
jgi:hypothetical protein